MDKYRAKAIDLIRIPLVLIFLFSFTGTASAALEITDFFSDYTSSEVTIRASQDHHGKEDTSGVVWKELGSGTYDISIRAVNKDNIALDKYETVLRIPEEQVESETPAVSSTPALAGLTGSTGIAAIVVVIVVLVAVRRKRGG